MENITSEYAVSLREVRVKRDQFSLGPLACNIPRGMVTAIVGPNGSGKSTLFRLLLGLEPIDEGEVKVLGTVLDKGLKEEYKKQVGFLAENSHAHESSLTAEEIARFASHWYPTWDWERYRKLLRHFNAEGNKKLSKLSKGMRRKVELSIAMAHAPELLLLDEPSSGLDPFAWKIMMEELQRYMELGDRTLVIASHITDEVRRLADYILFLYHGRILGLYEKDRLFDDWRTLLIQQQVTTDESMEMLQRTPSLQGMTEVGHGLYRLEVNDPEQGEKYCRSCGFQVLSVQRMELEDILGCLIRKEEARR